MKILPVSSEIKPVNYTKVDFTQEEENTKVFLEKYHMLFQYRQNFASQCVSENAPLIVVFSEDWNTQMGYALYGISQISEQNVKTKAFSEHEICLFLKVSL